jgi:glyoxylase-like metal-dependent hydrolase (beta-lactamase superfamily II)
VTAVARFICTTCGTQYPESDSEPERCPICEDERQYVGWDGQTWTTLEQLRVGHRNVFREEEPGLTGIGTEPEFAIGQRALVVQAPAGNILWDCISLLDDETVSRVRDLGGISAIAVCHPHFYASMVEWSEAFGDAPVYLHADDREWVMHPDPRIVFWSGETRELAPGLTLVRCGGHFAGGTVLHWGDGCEGGGALLSGDIITVVPDRRFVSFMYSYPNLIPLSARTVQQIIGAVEPFRFERIYGGWFGRVVAADGKRAVARSAERYMSAIGGRP